MRGLSPGGREAHYFVTPVLCLLSELYKQERYERLFDLIMLNTILILV